MPTTSATVSAERPQTAHRPLVSSLPTDNPEFQKIIANFAVQLREKLKTALQARENGDLAQVAAFAHWLKGAGGTVGFSDFTEPARQLEQLANAGGSASDMTPAWQTIRRLAVRLAATLKQPATSPPAGKEKVSASPPKDAVAEARPAENTVEPMVSRYADLPELQSVIRLFIDTLDENLPKMEQAYSQGDWEQLIALAHWLKGAGGTVGFDAFTKPAAALEKHAREQQTDQAGEMLAQVRRLKQAAQPPDTDGSDVETASIV
jgi:HPt (histidine-containing phosphotransfer) domain-containing protein